MMPQVFLGVLGRFLLTVEGRPAHLTPTNVHTLLRLLLAHGEPVGVDELYRQVWRAPTGTPVDRGRRTLVQRQISELRRIVDPQRPGGSDTLVATERGASLAYRLALPRSAVDVWHFEDLVGAAVAAEGPDSIRAAQQALAHWRGGATVHLGDSPAAARETARLLELRATAQRRLLRGLVTADRHEEARATVGHLLAERPGDPEVHALREELDRLRTPLPPPLLRHRFPRSGTAVTLTTGDLFALRRADLVVGFADTFDTSTRDDRVISSGSVQGQLLHRLYGGDRERLDRELRRALSGVAPTRREPRSAKPHGKLVRYPLGTVAVLGEGSRAIFCLAYSRLGNDLVARSTPESLVESLDRLWVTVHRHGQFADLALPLVGSGRSRLDSVDHDELLEMIVRSFRRASTHTPICRELYIVVPPHQLTKISIPRLRRLLDSV